MSSARARKPELPIDHPGPAIPVRRVMVVAAELSDAFSVHSFAAVRCGFPQEERKGRLCLQ
jgi:hypothetical protein